jgi:sortase A
MVVAAAAIASAAESADAGGAPVRARLIAGVLGTALLCGSFGCGGYVAAWDMRSSAAGAALTARAEQFGITLAPAPARASRSGEGRGAPPSTAAACVPAPTAEGELAGLLEVPALGLRAPVVEGEGDGVLADAVGHDPSSVPPGDDGTAVLAAHDVTYFGSLPSLRSGTVVRYFDGCEEHTFEVTSGEVVPAGTAVPVSLTPTLVLDTCWPTNALWWTPDRYLVFTREVSVQPAQARVENPAGSAGVPALSVPVPAALAAQGLGLDQNDVLLGTLEIAGDPPASFAESPAPLAVDAAAMTAYFGALHALVERRLDWWRDLAPGVTAPPAALGAAISQYSTRLDVTVEAAGDVASGAELAATVVLTGGAAPGTYGLRVEMAVRGHELVVSGWSLAPA